jgi:hypothetical protein
MGKRIAWNSTGKKANGGGTSEYQPIEGSNLSNGFIDLYPRPWRLYFDGRIGQWNCAMFDKGRLPFFLSFPKGPG